MAKFDLFNKNTWAQSVADEETIIKNKALGSMGQKIPIIRLLREDLANLKTTDFVEYNFAQDLFHHNREAFDIMEITWEYPKDRISKTIQIIDKILTYWKDQDLREAEWKNIIPLFQELEPYIKDTNRLKSTTELTKIKVSGNKAWEAYIEKAISNKYWQEEHEELRNIVDSLPVDED